MDGNEIKRIKDVVELALLRRPGVRKVDIGHKVVGGQKSGQLAIRIYVNNKGNYHLKDEVPKTIQGIPTDVIERRFQRPRKAGPFPSAEV